jgi:hypothetical protein
MKSLVEFIQESSRIRIYAKDLDPKEFEKWAEQVAKSGLGATVAKRKMQLVEYIVTKGKGVQTSLDVDVMPINWDNEKDPFFGDKIEEILHKYFHFVKSKSSGEVYLGPKKKTSPRSILRWLGDDYSNSQGYTW